MCNKDPENGMSKTDTGSEFNGVTIIEKGYKEKSRYFKEGMMIFIAGICLILFYYVINNTTNIGSGISKINDILFPFYLGIILAYLLCPTFNWTVKMVYRWNPFKFDSGRKRYRLAQFIGVIAALLVLAIFTVGFCFMVIPDLWSSVKGIADGMPDTISNINAWIDENVKASVTTSLKLTLTSLNK